MSAWRNSERRDGCRAAAAVRGGLVRSLVGVVLASLLLACAESPDPAPSAAKQALEPAPRRAAITAIHTAILGVSAKVTGDLIVTEGSSAMEATLGSASELVGSLAADAVVIGSGAEVTGDVEHNSLLNAGTVGGALVTPLALPLRAEIPPDVSCQPGTALVLVGGGQTVALASGAYGIVILTGASSGTPATLQLGGGTYELSGIIAGAFGVVECLAPCDVRVAGPVVLGSSSRLGAGAPEVGVLDVILTQPGSGQTLIVGAEATLDAYAVSRLGLATLGSGAQARGKLVADQVILGSSSRFVGLERPLISAQPAALAVREGQAAEFHVGAEGEGLRYQWLHGDDPIPGAISATFTVPAAALTDAGEYRVVVANDAGRVTSAAAGLTVIPCEPNDITCNDFDDDCDGQNDEDVPVVPTSCGTGACQACGFERCIEGALVDDCTPGVPAASDATCDGSDDDCDGSADEEYQPTPTACGVGACAASGQELCVGGGLVDTCAPLPAAPDDSVCDGVDADCDGAVDEDYLPTPTACGIGACAATGQTACEAGVVVSHCTEGLPTPDTVCNGVDDDCDGAVDEDYLPAPTACGIGACAATGQLRCVDGAPSDDCEPAAPTPDEDCDGVDDDCDGTPDDGYVPQVTTCGVGACQATGTTSCLAGQVADSCTPLPGQGSDAICNGIDDDCDGSPDEDYAPQPTSCGVGACAATGTSACVDGEEQSGCTPLAPGPADTGCDGVDDDCNGTADDGFVPEPIACGLGLCAATGIRTCEAGALVDHCTAPEPSVLEDLVCDGLDEDCDGSVDEDFAASATSCGSGVCHASGHTTCVAAQVIDTCAPGSPTGPDDDCNGVDEDCDGTADDGFVATPTSCGIGACARTGTRSCSGGTIADSCQPGAPPGDDEDCNGVDEDCDGAADDGFLPTPTTCGIGACAATGATWCDDGMVLDSCQPGTGAPSDATCDGLDDDCDGGTDEDFVPSCAGASRVICAGGALVSTDCGDGDACNGTETCSGAGVCILGIPPIIDDDNPCTDDACDPAMGVVHTATPAETPCGTGLWCDGAGNCIEAAQPPVIVTQPASLAVSVGQSWAFEVVATGNDLTYRWQRFGADVPGADTAAYGGDEASYDESGAEYRVVIENARGSVVSAPAVLSVIDDVAPVLTVSGAAERTTVEDRMALTGTVTDLGSGVVSVVVTSDRQPGQVFGGVLGPSATFSVEVSLSTGPNALIVVATDGEANQAAVPILVEATLPALPRVAILTPPNGSLVTVPLVDVTGRVHSSLPPEAIRLRLGSTVTFPEGTDGEYTFSFPSVHLVAGRNLLQVVAESAPGNATATSTVTYQEFVTPEEPLPPVITLLGVQEQQWVQGDSLPVSGWVEAETPVTRVTVNGQDARITGTGTRVSFDALLALPAGEDEVPVLVQAEDASGEGAELGFVVRHDSVSPAIAVDVLQPPPAVTSVTVSPYTITGHVTEPNLAGFTVNGRSIALSPGSDDVWSFDFDLALVRGVETTLAFEAWDHAGNRTTHGALVRLDAALSIEILQPSTGDQLVAQGDPLEVSVRARIPGVAPTDRITAAVGERPAVPLAVAATLASGTVTLPGADAAHELVVAVSTSDGTPLAQAVVRFRIVSDASIPVRVVRQSPENGAEHIEPEQALSFVFNKPIDFDRLQVVVSETVRGKTLAEPAPGADLTVFSDLRLADVNRQAEPVAGGLSFFVGDQMVAFYARGGFTWGATEQITVLYDGAEVHRGRVTVRPLPTLVQGFLVDQFDNALANVPVELVGLGRRTVSDAEGYFTFGFGTHADSIPAGRHLVRANPDLAEPTHGSLDFWVNAEAQHLTSIGVLSLPMLDRSISRRYVASGAAVELPDVGLTLDLTGAEVLFPDARASGELHVQKLALGRFSYPMVPMAMPAWVYAFQPSRIEVAGEIAFTAALEGQLGESELLDLPLDRVLIVAVDPDALMLVPAGVARVDREAAALVSERLEVERLDFLGVMVAPSVWQESLQRYATGELTLVELVARLSES